MDIRYTISLPERIIRAMAASVGGFLYEVTLLAFPTWFRRTRIYTAIVAGLLRIIVELIGGARGILPPNEITAAELATRKAAGTGIEFAGLLTLGFSPLWIFAITADLTGGTRAYLQEFVSELKVRGLLNEDEHVNTVDDLLTTLENSSGVAAETLDVPPLNVEDMRQTWENLRDQGGSLPSMGRLAAVYASMQQVAKDENTSINSLSSTIGAAAFRAGINTANFHIFDFYIASIRTIKDAGLVTYTKRVTLPYRMVAASHLDPLSMTNTERFLKRLTIKRKTRKENL